MVVSMDIQTIDGRLTLDEGVKGVQRCQMISFLSSKLAPLELSLDGVAIVDQEDVLYGSGISINSRSRGEEDVPAQNSSQKCSRSRQSTRSSQSRVTIQPFASVSDIYVEKPQTHDLGHHDIDWHLCHPDPKRLC